MNIQLQGRNITITDQIQAYVEKKSARLARYLPQIDEVRGELTKAKTRSADDRFTFQLTIWANRRILRSEEITGDVFASIDAAVDKIARQIEKVEGRRKNRRRKASLVENTEAVLAAVALLDEPVEDTEESEARVIRRKKFMLQPMNEAEAQEQLELLGHDFFLYFNPDEKSVNLIYRRKDRNYGLLQPQIN